MKENVYILKLLMTISIFNYILLLEQLNSTQTLENIGTTPNQNGDQQLNVNSTSTFLNSEDQNIKTNNSTDLEIKSTLNQSQEITSISSGSTFNNNDTINAIDLNININTSNFEEVSKKEKTNNTTDFLGTMDQNNSNKSDSNSISTEPSGDGVVHKNLKNETLSIINALNKTIENNSTFLSDEEKNTMSNTNNTINGNATEIIVDKEILQGKARDMFVNSATIVEDVKEVTNKVDENSLSDNNKKVEAAKNLNHNSDNNSKQENINIDRTNANLESNVQANYSNNLKVDNTTVTGSQNQDEFLNTEKELHIEDYTNINDENHHKNKKKSKKEFQEEKEHQEWEENIRNFVPDNLLTFHLEKREDEVFYEKITSVPTKITIAYYVHDENGKINFECYDPRNKLIHKIRKKNRGFLAFEANFPGVYEFHVEALKKQDVKVTFASTIHDESKKNINITHVESMEEKIKRSMSLVQDVHFNQQMITRKLQNHYEAALIHNSRIKMMSIVETLFMIIILVIQLIYLKKLIKQM